MAYVGIIGIADTRHYDAMKRQIGTQSATNRPPVALLGTIAHGRKDDSAHYKRREDAGRHHRNVRRQQLRDLLNSATARYIPASRRGSGRRLGRLVQIPSAVEA
jgi:hypothetical protein